MRIVRAVVLCLLPSLAAAQPLQPVQILHRFTPSPSVPEGGLLQVSDGSFYGVTSDTIYRLATNAQVTIAARFTDAVGATGTLVAGAGGVLYGTTQWGGDGGQGTVFRFDPASGELSTLHAFTGLQEGTSPFGGLAILGGQLYGVTRQTVFRTDPSSGATTILYTFGEGPLGLHNPTSGLTAGADGLLYGTTMTGPGTFPTLGLGALYRLNPATGAVSVAHAFTDINSPDGRLLLGPDNRMYGSAMSGPGLPGTGVGGIYRFDPATDGYELLHQLPQSSSVRSPGPLVMTPDGSLYGVTLGEAMNVVPALVSTLFRLRPTGGSYIYEVVRTFDFATTGVGSRAELVRGIDGLIYGYAKQGGAAGAGTLYRFDPAAGGPPSDPLSFTVLHAFVPTTTWMPSAPVFGPDGMLMYGSTSQGGSAQRGAIYALDPTTGAVTIRASIPGTPPGTWRTANTPLIVGADNALYGTTTAATTTADEHGIVRFEPAGNAVTNVLNSTVPAVGGGPYRLPRPDSPMVRAPTGDLYFRPGQDALSPGHEWHGDAGGHWWHRAHEHRTGARSTRARHRRTGLRHDLDGRQPAQFTDPVHPDHAYLPGERGDRHARRSRESRQPAGRQPGSGTRRRPLLHDLQRHQRGGPPSGSGDRHPRARLQFVRDRRAVVHHAVRGRHRRLQLHRCAAAAVRLPAVDGRGRDQNAAAIGRHLP